jgi:hypothetical protein
VDRLFISAPSEVRWRSSRLAGARSFVLGVDSSEGRVGRSAGGTAEMEEDVDSKATWGRVSAGERRRRDARAITAVSRRLLPALALALAPALAQADLSGSYVGHGARLDVVDSPSRVLVIYRSDPLVRDDPARCECTLEGQRQAGGVKLAGAMDGAVLRTAGKSLVVLQATSSVCCGLSWRGSDAFELRSRSELPFCRVKQAGAAWYGLEAASEDADRFESDGGHLSPGEEVVAVLDAPDDRFVPARRASDGRAGFLLRTELECLPPRSAPEADHEEARPPPATVAPPPERPVNLTPKVARPVRHPERLLPRRDASRPSITVIAPLVSSPVRGDDETSAVPLAGSVEAAGTAAP